MRSKLCRKLAVTAGLMATVLLLAAAALAESYPYNTTTNAKVNLRQSASSSAAVLTQVPKGGTITVVGTSGSYYKVTYGSKTGYLLKSFVNAATEATSAGMVSGYPYETVTTAKVNIRSKETASSSIVATVASGTTITVKGVNNGFAQVTCGKYSGYIVTDYVALKTISAQVATPTPASSAISSIEYITLSNGSSGSAVKALEAALKELGFFTGTPNSTFDSATVTAVKAFQKANGYTQTGTVDANLQAFLYNGKPVNKSGKTQAVTQLAPVSGVAIRVGNTGDLVTTVQSRLKELGYYTGSVSGTYDNATAAAVKSFQKKNSLTADGICGQKTREVMLSASAIPAAATATPKLTATPKPTATPQPTSTPTGTVKNGSTGNNAKLVQQRLRDLGYFTGKVDGRFGAESVKALKAFQQANGLSADGVAGSGTRKVLFGSSAQYAKATATPKPTATPKATATPKPAATPSAVVKSGSSGSNAKMVQQRLKDLGYFAGTVDGKFGSVSVTALKLFQKANGITADGVAGTSTYEVLFSEEAIAYNASTLIPTGTTLRQGSAGSSVTLLQQRLTALGYYSGTVDGSFGASTKTALIAFQKNNKLTADGVAGTSTIKLLNSDSAVKAGGSTTPGTSELSKIKASTVIYANWYTKVRPVVRQYQYATIYDFVTGASWQVHMFSFGNHAESEPLTTADTAAMEADFGGNVWNPKPVWVVLGNGQVYLATMHSVPHGVQHITTNGFPGHMCIHFPRTESQVTSIGPYATSHQTAVDAAWKIVQRIAEAE